jgi:hypothetical protein
MEYRYIEEIYDSLDFWPAWTPLQKVELGSVGYLKGYKFDRRTTLADLGVKVEEISGASGPQEYATKGSYSIKAKALGVADPTGFPNIASAKAGLRVSFSREWCALIATHGTTQLEIGNLHSVTKQLEKVTDWDPRWAIVTAVLPSEAVTVLISETKGSGIEISAEAEVSATVAATVDVEAGVKTASSDTLSYSVVGEGPCTPLFRVHYREDLTDGRGFSDSIDGGPASLKALAPRDVASWYE